MYNYADTLESYLIPAEEGFMDKVKDTSARIVAWFKALKEKVIAFFKKIIDKFRQGGSISEYKAEKERHSDDVLKFQNAISYTIQKMDVCIGYLSKAVGASRLVYDSDDDTVQMHIDDFERALDSAKEASDKIYIDHIYESEIFHIQKRYATKLEAIKNTFVQEIDLAIKIFSAGNNGTVISNKMVNQLCRANSDFLALYTKVLHHIY